MARIGQSGKQLQNNLYSLHYFSTILPSCFYEAEIEKNGISVSQNFQAHTWFTTGNRALQELGHYFQPALRFSVSKRPSFLMKKQFIITISFTTQHNIVMLVLWTVVIKRERKQMKEGQDLKSCRSILYEPKNSIWHQIISFHSHC